MALFAGIFIRCPICGCDTAAADGAGSMNAFCMDFNDDNACLPGFVPEIFPDFQTEMKWTPVAAPDQNISGVRFAVLRKNNNGGMIFQRKLDDFCTYLMGIMLT
jgi:hypothetical protein